MAPFRCRSRPVRSTRLRLSSASAKAGIGGRLLSYEIGNDDALRSFLAHGRDDLFVEIFDDLSKILGIRELFEVARAKVSNRGFSGARHVGLEFGFLRAFGQLDRETDLDVTNVAIRCPCIDDDGF